MLINKNALNTNYTTSETRCYEDVLKQPDFHDNVMLSQTTEKLHSKNSIPVKY